MRKLAPLLLFVVPLMAACHSSADAKPAAAKSADAATQLKSQLDAPGRAAGSGYQVKEVANAGKIEGVVTLAGPAPDVPPLKRTKDQSICGASGADESLILGPNNAVANAVVSVETASGKKMAPQTATLDQKGCTYVPHVQAVPVGTQLTLVNSDPLLHNVHSYLDDTTVFNAAEPLQGQKKTIPLTKPGLLWVKCDVHNWMNAWIYVADNPYFAVTGKDGKFEIDGLPAGTYTLKVWQERLAPTSLKVVVPANGTAKADVKLAPK